MALCTWLNGYDGPYSESLSVRGSARDTDCVSDPTTRRVDHYRERGGMRWGKSLGRSGYNFTWPFATLSATAQELVLAAPFYRFAFARSEIESVFLTSGIISIGLQVRHSRS